MTATPPPSAAVPDPADVEKAARAMCTYGHTKAHHDAAGACVRPSLDARAAAERAYPDPIRAAVRIAFERGWDAALAAVRPSPDSEAVARVLALDVWADPFGQWTAEQADAARQQKAEMERRIRAALGTGDRERQ